jgi:hypothetical protein
LLITYAYLRNQVVKSINLKNYQTRSIINRQIRVGTEAYPSHRSRVVTGTGYQDSPPGYLIV